MWVANNISEQRCIARILRWIWVEFQGPGDFEEALKRMYLEYDNWLKKIDNYPNTSDGMCERYAQLFSSLMKRREEILAKRKLWKVLGPLRNQLYIMRIDHSKSADNCSTESEFVEQYWTQVWEREGGPGAN